MQKHESGWSVKRTSFQNFLRFVSSLPAQEIMDRYQVRVCQIVQFGFDVMITNLLELSGSLVIIFLQLEKAEPSEWRVSHCLKHRNLICVVLED